LNTLETTIEILNIKTSKVMNFIFNN
jgi:hypothetical protein